jgi:regulator of RNase E activity RraB
MRTAIRASITSNVEASTSDALVTTVFTVVDRNNGNYDGWGAEVVE